MEPIQGTSPSIRSFIQALDQVSVQKAGSYKGRHIHHIPQSGKTGETWIVSDKKEERCSTREICQFASKVLEQLRCNREKPLETSLSNYSDLIQLKRALERFSGHVKQSVGHRLLFRILSFFRIPFSAESRELSRVKAQVTSAHRTSSAEIVKQFLRQTEMEQAKLKDLKTKPLNIQRQVLYEVDQEYLTLTRLLHTQIEICEKSAEKDRATAQDALNTMNLSLKTLEESKRGARMDFNRISQALDVEIREFPICIQETHKKLESLRSHTFRDQKTILSNARKTYLQLHDQFQRMAHIKTSTDPQADNDLKLGSDSLKQLKTTIEKIEEAMPKDLMSPSTAAESAEADLTLNGKGLMPFSLSRFEKDFPNLQKPEEYRRCDSLSSAANVQEFLLSVYKRNRDMFRSGVPTPQGKLSETQKNFWSFMEEIHRFYQSLPVTPSASSSEATTPPEAARPPQNIG